ncbi:helix-turn-helix domain-containing protein [Streptomyces sp. NPDC056149]|uniref:helix-turn-helix domain-containing protein n=1 Tax=Streptomyces sp. NPDC056149 TaxID=3345728 RepID=UPI0035DEBF16
MDKGKRITGAARDELAGDIEKAYEGGASIRAIAASLGRSYGFVHGILVEGGVTLRGRGGNSRREGGV